MAIINIRGTGGSGKSTVVRRVMKHYPQKTAGMEVGRVRPASYYCERPGSSLYVIGSYETPCGGCDTIKTPSRVYEMIWEVLGLNPVNIMFEGIIVQDDKTRVLKLNETHPVNIIEMDVPIEECLAGIQARRDARSDTRPLNPRNTIERAKRVHATCEKLRAAGMEIPMLGREEAYNYCLKLLELQSA